jgi:MFS family permease
MFRRTPGLARILAASLAGRLTLPFFGIGLLVDTRSLTGSYSAAGVVTGAYALSIAAGGPLLGRLADRRGRTLVLVASAGTSALLLLAFGSLPGGTSPLALVGLAAALGLATPPLIPCTRALLSELAMDADMLRTAYAFDAGATEASWVVGPPLGLAVAAVSTPGVALIAGGAALLAGTIAFAAQPESRRFTPSVPGTARRSGVMRNPTVRRLVLAVVGVGLLFGAAELGVTAVATTAGGPSTVAPLLGIWGGGGLIGGIAAGRLGGGARSGRGLAAILVALAGGHVALALTTHSVALTALVLLVAGTAIAPAYASVYALAERGAPAESRTETFAWIAAATALGNALGSAVAGVLLQHAGAVTVFAFAGAAGLLAAIIVSRSSKPEVHTKWQSAFSPSPI